MKTILFPTDFSENAENALRYALEFALKMNAHIVLFNVSPLPHELARYMEEAINKMEALYMEKLQKQIQNIKQEEKYKTLSIKAETTSGGMVSSILKASEIFKADLIVMGTKGASGLGKVFFGSNTAEVLRRAKVPVLVVPKDAEYKKFGKLIYAIDYREDDLDVLQELIKLGELLDIHIETLHVSPKDSLHEQIMHRGLVQLIDDNMSNTFIGHQLTINGSFFEGIEAYLNENPHSLLAMAHHKRSFLDSLLNKSITREMAYHTKTPLLIFNQE